MQVPDLRDALIEARAFGFRQRRFASAESKLLRGFEEAHKAVGKAVLHAWTVNYASQQAMDPNFPDVGEEVIRNHFIPLREARHEVGRMEGPKNHINVNMSRLNGGISSLGVELEVVRYDIDPKTAPTVDRTIFNDVYELARSELMLPGQAFNKYYWPYRFYAIEPVATPVE